MSTIFYSPTDQIKVFPSTRRTYYQISPRLMSEKSITEIINKLIDTKGFVITPDDEETGLVDLSNEFEFNIYGYYFNINNIQYNIIRHIHGTPVADNKIYANIYLDTSGNYGELQGQDVSVPGGFIYQGVTFSDDDLTQALSDPADYSLLLLVYDGTNWQVPVESRVKFEYNFALGVDGGEI